MSDGSIFSCLMDEYRVTESGKDNRKERIAGLAKKEVELLQYKTDSSEDVPMQLEERNVDAVSWDLYKKYLCCAGLASGFFILDFVNSYTGESRSSRISLIQYPQRLHANIVQLSRHYFLDFGQEMLYPASAWVYILRLVLFLDIS